MKKLIASIWILTILTSVTSCSETVNHTKTLLTEMQSVKYEGNYRLKAVEISDTGSLICSVPIGNGILAAVDTEDGLPRFYTADSSLRAFSELELPMQFSENAEIRLAMCSAADNSAYIAVTESNIEESADLSHKLYHISADGSLLSETVLTNIGETEIYSIAESNGTIYLVSDTVYRVIDGAGEKIGGASYGGSIGISSSGELCCVFYEDTNCYMKIGEKNVDLQQCGTPVSNIAGGDGFDAVFASNTGIFGISGDTITELTSNIAIGLEERSIQEIYPVNDNFVIIAFDRNLGKNCMYILTESTDEESEAHEIVTLKMGVFYEEDGFSSFMAQQNGSDSYVKIEPVYYTQYDVYDKNADKQVSTGLDQLNMDIISGNAPDMAVFMNTPQYLVSKGAFADLYTIMDEKLSRDDLMPNVLEACEVNGKLYSLPTSYNIRSMASKNSFSPVKNQSFDDMLNTLENAPEETAFLPAVQRLEVLTSFLSYSDFAADCKNGVCSVNRDNVRRLLEFCGTFPERFEYTDDFNYEAAMNESVYNEFAAAGFGDFKQFFNTINEPVTFTGYPSENGCGTVIVPVHTVAVLESCENKEAAWELIKCMYNSTNITNGINSGFPVVRDTFDKWAQSAKSSMGEENAAQAVDTVNSARSLGGGGIDNAIHRIIREESDAYFAGQYTAEQAADFIKNRTDIYVSEKS